MNENLFKRNGSVLIMVLWTLSLLTVFAIQIGLTSQDKIGFLARVDRHGLLRDAARSGIYKAIAVLKNEQETNTLNNPLTRAQAIYFNPGSFQNMPLGSVNVSVFYHDVSLPKQTTRNYGVTDEERRINLNKVSRQTIEKLINTIFKMDDKDADSLAGSLLDWRQLGDTEIEGFYSDNFYENLEFPYEEKKKDYELLSEIALVKGVTGEIYQQLLKYVTVYGEGSVNINTAPWAVLVALGFSEEQAGLIEGMRRGADGIAGTLDDFFFSGSDQLVEKLKEAQGLQEEDLNALRDLVNSLSLTVQSSYFRIESEAQLPEKRENARITCVFNINDDRIIYWYEE